MVCRRLAIHSDLHRIKRIVDISASAVTQASGAEDADALPKAFPIVGIGASAGGLEAITDLFLGLPHDSCMAFLIVQHLEPGHASLLAGILAQKTAMPVTEATDGQLVERDHVYVIPPNTSMRIAKGRLTLTPRNDKLGPPMPIDDLFHSLAEDQGVNAIGISLSGNGSDGALGMQTIKGEGGITFAQDDASARFNSMPHAAIGLGGIDFVLSPQKIAAELVRICQHPFMVEQPFLLDVKQVADDEVSLKRIFQILNVACGVDFTHYKRGTMTRRLARRIALLNLNSLPAYISFLEANPDEVHTLYQDLLIRVTSFFRDPEVFDGLTKLVFPELMRKLPAKASLRIWVPGCSSGEEVYSIAICLLEYLGEKAAHTKIQIFGTDVSEAALATARTGTYIENIAREVSEERLQRFFTKTKGHYQIAKSIRDLCIFAHQNVTSDPPFSQLDLISCRNLLIYFDPLLQKRAISLFHYALNPDSFLMLGSSETIGTSSDLFSLAHSKKFKIYTRSSVRPQLQPEFLGDGGTRKLGRKVTYKAPTGLTDIEKQKREIDRIALARYVPAGVLCDENMNVLEFRGDTGPYLIQPSGPPSTNLRQLARPGLLVEISSMIERARKEIIPVRQTALRVETSVGIREVNLEVIPFAKKDAPESLWFLIFFEELAAPASLRAQPSSPDWWTMLRTGISGHRQRDKIKTQQDAQEREIQHLKKELDATRAHIKMVFEEHDAAQEELKASQEELLSNNEEFQSTNEELETAKEELQSTNEELATTNDELRHRNDELNDLNGKLEQAGNYADAIVETVRKPLLVLDKNLHIVRANAAFYECFQLTAAETQNCLIYELDNRQWNLPALRQLLDKILHQDMSFQDYEITAEFPKIGEKTMLMNGRHLTQDDKSLILLAMEDMTERKSIRDALKEVDRRKDEFLAMLAHELRNPLAPIRNALEIWRRGDAGPEAEKEAQMILDRQLIKEARLVDDLLDVARITRGAIAIEKKPVDLVQIVKQAVEGTEHHYEARNHDLKLILPEKPIMVEGDFVRLEQIVSNLLSNAAKYTEHGGRVVLTLTAIDGKACLSVADNGVGISSQLLPQIFDLFVQADVSIDRSQGGLGIGLTLVRRLVELQGGTVEAKSQGLGKGSEFMVRLPLLSGDILQPVLPEIAMAPKNAPFKPRRILVVDDNADSAKTTALLLKLEGHEVQTTFDGPTAIKAAQTFKPEIVLLDIGLPGMNGYEVAQHLREAPATKNALLIALSGYGQPEDRRRSQEAGFDHHLVKPADMNQLNALILEYNSDRKTA